MTEKKTAIEKVRENLQEVKLDWEMNNKSNCQECVYCTTTAISSGDSYYCQKNKCFIGDMDNVCDFFEYQEKPLKYIEVGKIKEATKRYYSETMVHKVKLKEINEERKESLTEYEKTIHEFLKQHNQSFIEDVSVIEDRVLIKLERDMGYRRG